jgi:ABC-type arginine transport system ATPase subunit
VRENLVAASANRLGGPDPWTIEKIHVLFPRLAARGGNMGNQLSGGQQQMLAIGRALMTNPHLLILIGDRGAGAADPARDLELPVDAEGARTIDPYDRQECRAPDPYL